MLRLTASPRLILELFQPTFSAVSRSLPLGNLNFLLIRVVEHICLTTQEAGRFWFLVASLAPVSRRLPAKLYEPGLFRMQDSPNFASLSVKAS
jgi:hypothetical protein